MYNVIRKGSISNHTGKKINYLRSNNWDNWIAIQKMMKLHQFFMVYARIYSK